ncbi:MAG: DUF6115 domain-containing protein [Syntrophales bacterium]
MTPQTLFYIQLGIDALMCCLMLYFLWRVGKMTAGQRPGSEADRRELQRLIAESQQSAQQFLDALAEGRKSLKELTYALEEREARLQSASLRAEALALRLEPKPEGDKPGPFVDREQVLRMSSEGAPMQEIVRETGLTEGEVQLIIDLARSRDKNR